MLEINEKIERSKTEINNAQAKLNENVKLGDERRRIVSDLNTKLRDLGLEITEVQSIEYPQEADVEVMVNTLPNTVNTHLFILCNFRKMK